MTESSNFKFQNPLLGNISSDPTQLPKVEDCQWGRAPIEFNVIVVGQEVKEKSDGGVILPDQYKEKHHEAEVLMRVVAVSPVAFDYADNFPADHVPQIGDAVSIARFAGTRFIGPDGREYRNIKDKDILSIVPDHSAHRLAHLVSGKKEND